MATRRIELAKEPAFAMGDVAVEPAHRQLTTGTGRQVVIEHRVMQVLIALVQADGAIITRDELTHLCWDGRVVGDDAINRVISRLRRTAEELGGDVFRVETISKVGYRLILLQGSGLPTDESQDGAASAIPLAGDSAAALSAVEPPATPPSEEAATLHGSGGRESFFSRRLNLMAAAAVFLVAVAVGSWMWWRQDQAAPHSMAVRLAGYRLLSAGLPSTIRESTHAEIIAAFNVDGIVGVSIVSTPPRGRAPAYSLGGTIYRVGDSIRVISRLTNERSGVVLWSDSVDYAADQASKVPRKVAIDVGIVVRCGLSGAATYHKALPDPVLSNYMQYCREYWAYGGSKTLHLAQRVIAAAPDFSWGWSAVGNGYVQSLRSEHDGRRDDAMRRAGLLAEEKALKLDPNNAEALAHKAYLIDRRDWIGQEALFKAAVAAKPLDCGCEHYGYGLTLQSVGRLNAAIDQFRAATNMLALWPDSQLALAITLVAVGQGERAKPSFDAAIELSNDPDFDQWIAVTEALEGGDYPAAIAALRGQQLQLSRESRAALLSGYQALASGSSVAKTKAAEQLIALPKDEKSGTVVRMLGALGANDAALKALGERPWLLWRGSMRGVLHEPSFPAVARQLGLMTYWRASRTKPDVCTTDDEPRFCHLI